MKEERLDESASFVFHTTSSSRQSQPKFGQRGRLCQFPRGHLGQANMNVASSPSRESLAASFTIRDSVLVKYTTIVNHELCQNRNA